MASGPPPKEWHVKVPASLLWLALKFMDAWAAALQSSSVYLKDLLKKEEEEYYKGGSNDSSS